MAKASPKEIIQTFKQICGEASKFYGKRTCDLNFYEYGVISNGRSGHTTLGKVGGFAKLRDFYFPKDRTQIDPQYKLILSKLLK